VLACATTWQKGNTFPLYYPGSTGGLYPDMMAQAAVVKNYARAMYP
jgi:hypothetical protein